MNCTWGKSIPFLQIRKLIFIGILKKKKKLFYNHKKKLIGKKIKKLKEGNGNAYNLSIHR